MGASKFSLSLLRAVGLPALLVAVLCVACGPAAVGETTLPPPARATAEKATTPAPSATPSPRPTFAFGGDAALCAELAPACDDASPACIALQMAQQACGSDGAVCLPDLEINCRRHVADDLLAAIAAGRSLYAAPASLCSGVTVGGIGYADRVVQPYRLSNACLAQVDKEPIVNCRFLGQTVAVGRSFCERLSGCVEPQLAAQYPTVGGGGRVPRYAFPSGAQQLVVDLSCSEQALPTSRHHPANGCNAIDINVAANVGTLRPDLSLLPISNMPPEFVAIMEGCGLVWGGRYTAAENVSGGCDPMEFVYAPACRSSSP